MIRAARSDRNQSEIVEAFRRLGAHVVLTHQLKNFCDCIVYYKGRTLTIEIKDGRQVPSKRKLTEGEAKCKAAIEATGNQYHIIESVDDVIKLIFGK